MGSRSTSRFPGFDKIFDLSNALEPRFVTARIVTSDGSIAAENEATVSNPSEVLRWKPVGGARRSPVMWTSLHFFLIDQALHRALTDAGISGWIPQETECSEPNTQLYYVGFRVVGRCGPQDLTRGTWVRDQAAAGPWKVVLRGLYFDEDSWDGSDVFSPQGTYRCLVTERAAEVFARSDIPNIRLTKIVEFEVPELVLQSQRRVQEGQ